MGVDEVSKLAYLRGCNLQVMGYNGVLLYWIENSIFVSKPFSRLEELIDLLLRLPVCDRNLPQASETIAVSPNAFCTAVLLDA